MTARMTLAAQTGLLPVLAVTGLAKEARLAEGPGVIAVGAGGNPHWLRQLLTERGEAGCRAVVSFGIAGGLDPALAPGDIVIATGIVSDSGRIAADAALVQGLLARLNDPRLRVVSADL